MRRENVDAAAEVMAIAGYEVSVATFDVSSREAVHALQAEVAPFSINTTIVNPGFFRTELLTEHSTNYAEASISDYDERRAQQLEFWKTQNGLQSGDPAKLARALMTIANREPPPRRFIAGADAIATAEQKIADLQAQIEAERELSTSLDFDRAGGDAAK